MVSAAAPGATGAPIFERRNSRTVAAFALLGVLGGTVFLAMPVIVAALRAAFQLSDVQAGQFASVQLIFISMGCLSSLLITRYIDARQISRCGLLTIIAVDVLSPVCPSYTVFLGLRALSGIAGGILISLTIGSLARMPNPDRNIGVYQFAQIAFSTVALFTLPLIASAWGAKGIFFSLVILEVTAFSWIVRSIPPALLVLDATRRQPAGIAVWASCLIVMFSIFTFCLGIGAFWTYAARIGEQAGLNASVVGRALSAAMGGGLAGALVSIMIPIGWGRVAPILLASAATLVGLGMTGPPLSVATFSMAAALFCFGWYLLVPYQFGTLGSMDVDGRPSLAAAAFSGIGLGLGPLLVARDLRQGVQAAVSLAEATTAVAATALLAVIGAHHKWRRPLMS